MLAVALRVVIPTVKQMTLYYVVENKLEIHDLHATILHLMGLDHERSTFRFSGRDMRLTDVRRCRILV